MVVESRITLENLIKTYSKLHAISRLNGDAVCLALAIFSQLFVSVLQLAGPAIDIGNSISNYSLHFSLLMQPIWMTCVREMPV